MADVRPFRALRYGPDIDLSTAICPPYDIISPSEQIALHERSPSNAIRIELALDGEERYRRAREALEGWLVSNVLRRDQRSAFYIYRQQFTYGGRRYSRNMIFARVRAEEWEEGAVRPHEHTFGGPKEDRMKLLRAVRLNTSPVYLLYQDKNREITRSVEKATVQTPVADFSDDRDQTHTLWLLDDPSIAGQLSSSFARETLYVADGHHRYETSVAYRNERRAAALNWDGEEPDNFVMAALTAADDPGLLVLPIHRIAQAEAPLDAVLQRLGSFFNIQTKETLPQLLSDLAVADGASRIGLLSADSSNLYLLSVSDTQGLDRLMPENRSPAWRKLDYAIANYPVLRHGLGLTDKQMEDIKTVWFTESAEEALSVVRGGDARYAVLLNPIPVPSIMSVADTGEKMPQKSTFFYPKVPTGLVFNSLDD